jgi:hypothetical protein
MNNMNILKTLDSKNQVPLIRFLSDSSGPVDYTKLENVIKNDTSTDVYGRTWRVANGLIGVKPAHPFFKRALDTCGEHSKQMRGKGAWREVGPAFITTLYEAMKDQYPDITVYPMAYFYPLDWHGITDPEHHKKVSVPEESMLFQYGYSTNHFDKILKERARWETLWNVVAVVGAIFLVYLVWRFVIKSSRGVIRTVGLAMQTTVSKLGLRRWFR